jgi:hypothetical protein
MKEITHTNYMSNIQTFITIKELLFPWHLWSVSMTSSFCVDDAEDLYPWRHGSVLMTLRICIHDADVLYPWRRGSAFMTPRFCIHDAEFPDTECDNVPRSYHWEGRPIESKTGIFYSKRMLMDKTTRDSDIALKHGSNRLFDDYIY